ncbi:uncharacterized protein TRIADDRAFT_61933 [Trichoplax adhaerens]|uniref:Uncharacterized protein n=1 Tax=Trichoplax adhaerens TaxID=10228 RepID=B3SCD2_TRIAD|nr:predicted protein [Trichoplax adhaerens]EDV19566.1 predicted protein [Trichoplax adhaerens]|eukprot:XP_002117899.1 predicted protein [Trichoplax adhaerens]
MNIKIAFIATLFLAFALAEDNELGIVQENEIEEALKDINLDEDLQLLDHEDDEMEDNIERLAAMKKKSKKAWWIFFLIIESLKSILYLGLYIFKLYSGCILINTLFFYFNYATLTRSIYLMECVGITARK